MGMKLEVKLELLKKVYQVVIQKRKLILLYQYFQHQNQNMYLAVMLDEPKGSKDYIYHYRDGSNIKYKGTPYNTAGWTSVEVVGQIIEKIGPILATKYSDVN